VFARGDRCSWRFQIQWGRPLASTRQHRSLSPGARWGFNFQNLPNTHVEEPPTAPAVPNYPSYKSKWALSNVPKVSGPSKYSTPNQTATHTTSTASRNRRPLSVTSSDEVSDLSDNSLTTPPAQTRGLLIPIYGHVGLPPPVPGTGRTNPVNFPPTQQSQNPDSVPPPGVVNEPPAPTTTTSTRGRAPVAVVRNGGREGRSFDLFRFHLPPLTLSGNLIDRRCDPRSS